MITFRRREEKHNDFVIIEYSKLNKGIYKIFQENALFNPQSRISASINETSIILRFFRNVILIKI